ncbi:hypothetical protein CY35_10G027700 [Sphagnum magellanicum]|nr:hypothetical protein CY35_10G027700 [Sphagnum magellanicum]
MKEWEVPKRRCRVCTPVLLCVIMSGFFIAYTRGVGALCLPSTGCTTALAYYTLKEGDTLDIVGNYFQVSAQAIMNANSNITNVDTVFADESIYIPFACLCINGQLGQNFAYKVTGNDTLNSISSQTYEGLTQPAWIASQSGLANPNFINEGALLAIPVNCSCGNPTVSLEFGLFVTYVVGSGTADNLTSVAAKFNLTADLVRKYNPGVSWDNPQQNAQQIAFIPVTDQEGNYPPYTGPPPASSAAGGGGGGAAAVSTSVIVGAVIGGLFGLIGVVAFLYCFCVHFLHWPSRRHHRNKFKQRGLLASDNSGTMSTPDRHKSPSSAKAGRMTVALPVFGDFSVDKSVEFSYEELAMATNDFNVVNKIGEGGFGAVYYGVIRGQKLAIKRMNLQATKEFMAELQVLTHVHHTNLVQLVGYCTVEFLFLVYEFIDNGTLDQHLHNIDRGRTPLSWTARVQIALDAARGLEYIHEHTKPTYIHRDIKSANILIDKELHAKTLDCQISLQQCQLEWWGRLGTCLQSMHNLEICPQWLMFIHLGWFYSNYYLGKKPLFKEVMYLHPTLFHRLILRTRIENPW